MAEKEIHRRDCKILLGNDFVKVHQWLDATAAIFPPKGFDTYHRIFRHHIDGLAKIRMIFGDEAVLAGRVHILRDLNHIVEIKGKLYILIKEYWHNLTKKNLVKMIKLYDEEGFKYHDMWYIKDPDEEILVYGHWRKIQDIEKIYPELHKEMNRLQILHFCV